MGDRYLFVAQYLWSSLPGSSLVLNFFCERQRHYASVLQMWRGLRFGAFDAWLGSCGTHFVECPARIARAFGPGMGVSRRGAAPAA